MAWQGPGGNDGYGLPQTADYGHQLTQQPYPPQASPYAPNPFPQQPYPPQQGYPTVHTFPPNSSDYASQPQQYPSQQHYSSPQSYPQPGPHYHPQQDRDSQPQHYPHHHYSQQHEPHQQAQQHYPPHQQQLEQLQMPYPQFAQPQHTEYNQQPPQAPYGLQSGGSHSNEPISYGAVPKPVHAPSPVNPPAWKPGYPSPQHTAQGHPSYSNPLPAASHECTVSNFRSSGRKRALLIGICYAGTESELAGCANDVKCIHYLLSTRFGFQQSDFVILTDRASEMPQTVRKAKAPTRANILQAMKNLVAGAQPGDSLFLQFSGHGSQVPDTSGDEVDGLDETILPLDFKTAGQITDDEMYKILVRGVPMGVRLTVLFDCCHSGTGLDLPYSHDILFAGSGTVVDGGGPVHSVMSTAAGLFGALNNGGPLAVAMLAAKSAGDVIFRKKLIPHKPNPNAGEVVLFSGCLDNQYSADTNALTGNTITGAMTFCFIHAIENGSGSDWRNHNYRTLLQAMRQKIIEAGLKQTPQFSTSHPFDLKTPFLI